METDKPAPTFKKHRGKGVAKVGIYPTQMEALVATKPFDKSLTQYINDLLLEVLNAKR